ncbi:Crp/Fnr family transcriptional regulator [Dyadobacter sp. CY261]|uniref:Crp/Fnr family transcriptional regulator n=1 Tax=Dyadobacter sp. CY261 TaxID=2907203 RepID=UPI001F24FE7C|nr:Crp/Fnr family transcriptional regulator [Dyadobacter sp. CY261]MCF0069123.1 Crp/Fnr family transcriptional regulator [Dyadobacter sp. CY261]
MQISVPHRFISFLQLTKAIPPADQALILNAFKIRDFREGDVLFKGGKVCQEMFFVLNGVLRIMVTNEKGNEITHYFLKENQFCTILNSFNNHMMAHESICAACPVQVLSITRAELFTLYTRVPYLKAMIDMINHQTLLEKIQVRNAYLGQDSAMRYQQFLIRQSDIATRVPLSDIASYLGITPQSLSRIRRNLR